MIKTKMSFLMVALISLSSVAQAADRVEVDNSTSSTSNGLRYLGLLAGGNGSTNTEGTATPAFGLTLGTKIVPSFGVGVFGSYSGRTTSGTVFGLPAGTSTSTVILAGQANYFLGGLHLGGEIGAAISSWSGHISNAHVGESTTSLILGPVAGYDFIIGKSVSLGAEGHYLVSTADSDVNNVQILAALKIWQ